ncbi:hypothetical protein NE237_005208 [Protea cynaroides]|uniref:SOSEKI DIX-like domain-containing protein n=1 Tax=Protea cynaroides TaxID=273540 RepID=A0A9Q0KKD9_9MAGN|nr:hypothetical protein NE237_005208 [Protea cynaroides]
MEVKGGTVSAAAAAAAGELMATQVRRIHVIYFLSRMGRIEHPHLIRVHHLSRNGVYLRDVKRWLSDLRGKDMPDSYAWSYKRSYREGYVWQDLVDDDLITPISDNEYVLKGSEISSIPMDASSCDEKKDSKNPDPVEDKLQQPLPEIPYTKMEVSPKTSEIEIEIDEESPEPQDSETSTMTDASMKSNANKPEEKENDSEKKNRKSTEKIKSTWTNSAKFTKSKSYSSGASQVFRNLLTCGAVDTNDSVLMKITRIQRSSKNPAIEAGACQTETIDGSQRMSDSGFNQQPHQQNSRKSSNGVKTSKKTSEKPVSADSKPVIEPICSQCGKPFNPEKLYSHMKSCKGMKNLSKTAGGGVDGGIGGAAAAVAPEKTSSWRSTDASAKALSTNFLN